MALRAWFGGGARRRDPGSPAATDELERRLASLEAHEAARHTAVLEAIQRSHMETWDDANRRHEALDRVVREIGANVEAATRSVEAALRDLAVPVERTHEELVHDFQAAIEALVYVSRSLQELRTALEGGVVRVEPTLPVSPTGR